MLQVVPRHLDSTSAAPAAWGRASRPQGGGRGACGTLSSAFPVSQTRPPRQRAPQSQVSQPCNRVAQGAAGGVRVCSSQRGVPEPHQPATRRPACPPFPGGDRCTDRGALASTQGKFPWPPCAVYSLILQRLSPERSGQPSH